MNGISFLMIVIEKATGLKAKVYAVETEIDEVWLIVNNNRIVTIGIDEFWNQFEKVTA